MRQARLGDVVTSMKNGIYKPASAYAGDGIPCLRMYNIDRGGIAWRDIKRMKVSAAEQADYGLLEGDLLVNRVNSRELVGKAAVIPSGMEPSVFESKNIRVRLDTTQVVPKFINYQLFARGSKHFANNAQQVVGMASISQGQLADFPVVLTDLDEQRRIVAEIDKQFSRLDEAVANLQRVKANLKRYKASVLKAAVEGRLVETEASIAQREGRSYETGEQLLQRILEDRKALGKAKSAALNQPDPDGLPACPEGWSWTTCDAAINSIDAGASFKCEERPPVPGEVGVLKVSALTWGTYDENESKTCKDEERIEEKYLVRDDDFLFSRANTIELVGACVIVGKTTKQLMLSDKTLRFKLDKRVLPDWLLICLRCQFGRDEIERLATGNQESMRNIGQERIRQIRMPLPPLSEQNRIVAEVDRHLSIIREVEAEVDANMQRVQALRQSILSLAFSPKP